MANNEITEVVVNGNTYKLVGQDVNLAPIETDASSASKSYAIGDHLVVDNDYCKVIAAISAGDALVKGTNIQSAKVGDEINQLNTSFSNALTSLKNTAIAQAVGAIGNTFTSVIAKLAEIVNRGAWSANMSSTGSVTIPNGYHNGTGTVKTSGTATITTNGTHNIAQYTNANVNVTKNPYHSRFVYGIDSLNMTRMANRCYYLIAGSNQLAIGYININGAFTWLRDIGSGTSSVYSVSVGAVGGNINFNSKGYNHFMTIIEVLAS